MPPSKTQLDTKSIQGNVLKGFSRKRGVYLFASFKGRAEDVRPRLGRLLKEYVTSASCQAEMTAAWKQTQQSPGAGMFGLSWSGYNHLARATAVTVAPELGGDPFKRGMFDRQYWDLSFDKWEEPYRSSPSRHIDCFLFLADDEAARLDQTVDTAKKELSEFADIVAVESAGRLFESPAGGAQYEIEHFGFRDGISQPGDPSTVFTQEPLPFGDSDEGGFGCYAAFMKIEQDVAKFAQNSKDLVASAEQQGVKVTPQDVQELALGRRHNGDPLLPQVTGLNDFSFRTPPDVCPYHAHVRVMNPRDDPRGGPQGSPIVRRSMTYGAKWQDGERATSGSGHPRGLLFLSLQKSLLDFTGLIRRAFQSRDPILGRSAQWTAEYTPPTTGCKNGRQPGQLWRFPGKQLCFQFADVTTIRGGEFFYIPSMRFIDHLAKEGTSATSRTPLRAS
jgi:Dyp-type peroxidase family